MSNSWSEDRASSIIQEEEEEEVRADELCVAELRELREAEEEASIQAELDDFGDQYRRLNGVLPLFMLDGTMPHLYPKQAVPPTLTGKQTFLGFLNNLPPVVPSDPMVQALYKAFPIESMPLWKVEATHRMIQPETLAHLSPYAPIAASKIRKNTRIVYYSGAKASMSHTEYNRMRKRYGQASGGGGSLSNLRPREVARHRDFYIRHMSEQLARSFKNRRGEEIVAYFLEIEIIVKTLEKFDCDFKKALVALTIYQKATFTQR